MPHHKNKTSFKKNDPRFQSRAFRVALSKSLKGKYVKEKSWKWKGGKCKRDLVGYVMKRDKFQCQWCKLIDMEVLEVDHIQPTFFRSDLERDPKNMITLCANCHRRKTRFDQAMIHLWKKLNKKT